MELEKIKTDLSEQLVKTNNIKEITNYLNALSVIEGIEKTDADKRKSELDIKTFVDQKKTDFRKFYISVLAPFLTALALIATVFVQILQTHTNYDLQIKNKEEENWEKVLNKIASPDAKSDGTIPELLKPLYVSATYKNRLCDLLTNEYFPKLENLEKFQYVFKDFVEIIDANNYNNLVNLSSKLNKDYGAMLDKFTQDNDLLRDAKALRKDTDCKYYQRILKGDSAIIHNVSSELNKSCTALRDIVNRLNTGEIRLDLSQACFFNMSLDSVNLKGADITDATFEQVSLRNADLSGIKNFDHSDWDFTPWWQAKKLDKELVIYLKSQYPYDSQKNYPGNRSNHQNEYHNWLHKYNLI